MSSRGFETVIGLEVHCQLGTRTKLFCGCAVEFGAAPNSRVCPVCSGAPGALPVLNAGAVRLAMRAALSLGCTLDRASRFDRKHYFYCDLPKGYQITQYARPLATGGGLELANGRCVHLTRIHIEEDAGKAIHDRGPDTWVDLNRAGVPLIEIVTAPELTSSSETHEYLTRLKETLQFAGVSECNMEKGSLRCDVNVSVRRPGEPLGTRIELKNLNSFKHVVLALEHEIARQVEALERGESLRQETRLFDAERGTTRVMRVKESEDDYRYLPDPDLGPVALDDASIARARAELPEAPGSRRSRWQRDYGLSAYDAGVLSSTPALADFFEETARISEAPKESANWLANDVVAAQSARGASLTALRLTPARLAELIGLVQEGTLSRSAAKSVLEASFTRDESPSELVRELGLAQISDPAAIETLCRAALLGAEQAAADLRAGELKALGALIGRVMKASGGRAHPELVRSTLQRLVQESSA